ncbi:hypothetical protein EVAR_47083_1 [Eumeta japonica]|uniref:Uncharacterized protein n=1 Tax=Eumeta variegata TaxID=151549 RepID=A0A4C1YDT4_EUMVA|nr:hypothetical protein EVAR_47083_1 [Eumeta japonica]
MVTAAHGRSQSQRSHQCVADLLGGYEISKGGVIVLREGKKRSGPPKSAFGMGVKMSLPICSWTPRQVFKVI